MGSLVSRITLSQKPRAKVLVVGLDNAGKMTLLQKLSPSERLEDLELYTDTREVIVDGVMFVSWHLGCSIKIFPNSYHHLDADGIIFVVDSTDVQEWTVDELHRFLDTDFKKHNIPLLLFANKTDLPSSKPAEQIAQEFELEKLEREWHVQPAQFINDQGITEGINWLKSRLN